MENAAPNVQHTVARLVTAGAVVSILPHLGIMLARVLLARKQHLKWAGKMEHAAIRAQAKIVRAAPRTTAVETSMLHPIRRAPTAKTLSTRKDRSFTAYQTTLCLLPAS